MKCPKCRIGHLKFFPPPPECIDEYPKWMGACTNVQYDYMGDGFYNEGQSFSDPEHERKEFELQRRGYQKEI